MDFASLMSAEIARSKPTNTQSKSPTPSNEAPNQKYLRRADVEAQRQRAYQAEQEAGQKAREAKQAQKRKREEEEAEKNAQREAKLRRLAEESRVRREEEEAVKERARRRRLGLPELPPSQEGDGKEGTPLAAGEEDIGPEELKAKLRALDEPVLLFGETHKATLRRYRKLTAARDTPAPTLSNTPIPTTLSLLPEKDMLVPPKPPKAPEAKAYLFRQLASYFTMVFTAWSAALSARDADVKNSSTGRTALNAYLQSRENMRPLFKQFESGTLADSILEPVVEIVRAAQERRYVDANNGYLRLSIGKAAWPIGVTMVGIHERSAREKLHESDKGQAHIMADEVTRKFLQSIKRCLSFAQTRWPPDDHLQLMG